MRQSRTLFVPLYGYARVSSIDQDLRLQRVALKAAGRDVVRAEKASGGLRDGGPSLLLRAHMHAIDDQVQIRPCLVANCAVVSSPRSASRATFALKSTEYRFRLPVIQVRRAHEQTELKPLSGFRGPPHSIGDERKPN
jgi:hypothetical protein